MRACPGSATHASGIFYLPKAIAEQQFYIEMSLQIELSPSPLLAFRVISEFQYTTTHAYSRAANIL